MPYQLKITVGDTVLTATLNDTQTSQEFRAQLPLSFLMNDLLEREKFAHLSSALSENGEQVHTFAVGDIVYFAPATAVALFYRQDGAVIESGLYLLGKLDAGSETLWVPGPVEVHMELAT